MPAVRLIMKFGIIWLLLLFSSLFGDVRVARDLRSWMVVFVEKFVVFC